MKRMLKFAAIIFALTLIFALPMSAEEYLTGDMNGDGVVNTNDAIYLLRHVLQPKDYTLSCNHNFEYHDAKDATCTEAGHNAYVKCTRCDYTTYKEIPALGHDEIAVQGKSATCTEGGLSPYVYCSRCDYTLGYKVIPALGHNYVGGKCSVCGEKDPNAPAYSEGLAFTSNGNGTCYVSGIGSCKDTDLCIPTTSPAGDSVTSIGEYAFESCTGLTSVTIGDSVTSIGEYAFYYCSSLTSVTIPDSVTSIGDDAFYSCDSLTSVTIPGSVTSIGEWAFEDCGSLTSVTIGDSVTSIGNAAFQHCDSLTSVTIGDSVTSIGNAAFFDCDSLTSITIPDSVTSIGTEAFYYCDSLTSIVFEDTSTWYRTTSSSYTGGTQTSVTSSSTNAKNFKYSSSGTIYNGTWYYGYADYYWYKK